MNTTQQHLMAAYEQRFGRVLAPAFLVERFRRHYGRDLCSVLEQEPDHRPTNTINPTSGRPYLERPSRFVSFSTGGGQFTKVIRTPADEEFAYQHELARMDLDDGKLSSANYHEFCYLRLQEMRK